MHSVETGIAIVRIQDDILRSLDARKLVVMVLPDINAAFDSVDHDLLLAKLNQICLRGVSTSANIHDLGVQLDSNMSVAVHVSRTCLTAYAQLRGIARIRSFMPLSACKTFVHALIFRDLTSEKRPCMALPEPCCVDLRWSSHQLRVSSSAYVDVTNPA